MTILILYFLAGVLQDFLVTLNWRFIAEKRPALAAIFSFVATVVSFVVLYDILTRLDAQRSIISIFVYAAGVGVGTLLGMAFKPGFKS
jgi:uncharacterized protein YebE (UPF0316 family)